MKLIEAFIENPVKVSVGVLIVALFGASLVTVTIAIGVVSWTAVARITRAEFLRIRVKLDQQLFQLQALHLLDFFGELAPKMVVRLDCVEALGDQTLICRAHRGTRCACRSVAG